MVIFPNFFRIIFGILPARILLFFPFTVYKITDEVKSGTEQEEKH